MKKIVILLSILLLSAGGVYLLDADIWGSKLKSSQPPLREEPPVITDFKIYCDSLESQHWNAQAFQNRVDRLNVFYNQRLLEPAEYEGLSLYMYSAYVKSLKSSYDRWSSSCNEDTLRILLPELKRIAAINTTNGAQLEPVIREINQYYRWKQIPGAANALIKRQYDSETWDQLTREINTLPSSFNGCTNIRPIKRDVLAILNEFKKFGEEFYDVLGAFEADPDHYYSQQELRQLGRRADRNGYTFYTDLLKNDNFSY